MLAPLSTSHAKAPAQSHFGRMTAAEYLLFAAQAQAQAAVSGGKRPKRASPEEDLQRSVFEWIFLHEHKYPVLEFTMHVPNGGRRSKGEAGRFKAMGVRKGISDVVNPFPQPGGAGFACELKASKDGRATPEQLKYLKFAKSNGWVTGICFTLDQFIVLIEQYLGVHHGGTAPVQTVHD